MTTTYELTDLEKLEAEAVHIFREVAATIERPALLFSGGKDSVVMLHLAVKAFWPARVPFPVMHVDTGQNFDEVIEFRDKTVEKYGLRLIVEKLQDDIDAGRIHEEYEGAPRNRHQTVTLLRGIRDNKFGAVFGGARRDEEKARAKERVFSFRDEFGAWDPRNQRPELWNLYNGRHRKGENIRVFPLSNWTELDIWTYIRDEQIELPELYFAHKRKVVERDGMLYAVNRFIVPEEGEHVVRGDRALPHDGRRHHAPAVSSPSPRPPRQSSRRWPPRVSPSAARPAVTTASARPAWKTARKRAISKCRSFCVSPRPARSTTASRR